MAHFTISKQKTIQQYKDLQKHVDVVSYSAKTNYEVVPLLEETDAQFSIHSERALQHISRNGKTMFFPQGWTKKDIQRLIQKGVYTFILDNEPDIQTLLQTITPEHDLNILLRLRLKERSIRTGKHYVFGIYSDTLNTYIPKLLEHKGVSQVGVHAHRKSQNVSEWRLRDAFTQNIDKEYHDQIHLISMGGGIPVTYNNYTRDNTTYIKKQIQNLHDWTKQNDITLITEPGRYIAAPPGKLHTTIKHRYDNNLILDCSVFNAAMDTFVLNTRLEVEQETTKENGQPYTLKGTTPDSLDIFRYKVYLNKPEVGDTITFKNATAYNYASDFCDLPKLPTKIIK